MKENKILVLGWFTFEDSEDPRVGCVAEETHCYTIKEAKHRARYMLTEDYQRSGELHRPLEYSQVRVNDEVHSDFFRE